MKSLKVFETTKLHYNKYLYKIEICNILASYFRGHLQKDKQLSYVKIKLDQLNLCYTSNKPMTKIMFRSNVDVPTDDFLDAKDIYSVLKNQKDYTIRVEGLRLSIYTNNKGVLVEISKRIRNTVQSFWEPKLENLNILKQNIKIVSEPTNFIYQVYFKNPSKIDSSFAKWLVSNPDKSKIGVKTLENINNGLVKGCYFYVRDEKILMIIQMIIGNAIYRVDKLVYIED